MIDVSEDKIYKKIKKICDFICTYFIFYATSLVFYYKPIINGFIRKDLSVIFFTIFLLCLIIISVINLYLLAGIKKHTYEKISFSEVLLNKLEFNLFEVITLHFCYTIMFQTFFVFILYGFKLCDINNSFMLWVCSFLSFILSVLFTVKLKFPYSKYFKNFKIIVFFLLSGYKIYKYDFDNDERKFLITNICEKGLSKLKNLKGYYLNSYIFVASKKHISELKKDNNQ